MTKEQALEGFIGDLQRIGFIGQEYSYRARIMPVAAKYINPEHVDALVRYSAKFNLSSTVKELWRLVGLKKSIEPYFKPRQIASNLLEQLRIINTKMMQEVYAGTYTL